MEQGKHLLHLMEESHEKVYDQLQRRDCGMRMYSKSEFPEITKVFDDSRTVSGQVKKEITVDSLPGFESLNDSQKQLYEWFTSDEHLRHIRSGKSNIATLALLHALKERLKTDKEVKIVYLGPTPTPSWVEELNKIEGVSIEVPGDEVRGANNPCIISDQITETVIAEMNSVRFTQDIQDPERFLKEKKSRSTNPSDRWIKPKKLYRAKGKRK